MFDDLLMPSTALLPLADTRGGGHVPIAHESGPLRPFSATLAVVPIECGKHDTTASKWDETKPTQRSRDGVVEPDTITETKTDT